MFIPLEFPFTHAYLSTKVMPAIDTLVRKNSYFMKGLSILDVFLVVWGVGIVIRLCVLFMGYRAMRKPVSHSSRDESAQMVRVQGRLNAIHSIPRNIRIIRTNVSNSPMVFGFNDVIINVPGREYTDQQLYYFLLHELYHYYNRDLWIKLALEIVVSLYWWFPVISVLFKNLVINIIEFRADDAVAKLLSDEDRVEYLSCILDEVKEKKKQSPLLLNAKKRRAKDKILTQRFALVLGMEEQEPSKTMSIIGVLVAVILLVASFLFVIQPHYDVPGTNMPDARFTLDYAYIIQYQDVYIVYSSDGQEIMKLDELGNDFDEIPIYQAESEEKLS